MMLEIPLLSRLLVSATSRRLDDLVDRLHFEFTVTMLVLFSMFIGGKQHFGQPIQCMMPTHMDRSSWTSYGQYYCFIENTYRLTYNSTLPNANIRAGLREMTGVNLTYYQWVPYFLAIQAFCFFAPSWLWRLFQSYSYVDMQTIVDEAVAVRHEMKMDAREKRLTKLVEFISATFSFRNGFRNQHHCTAVSRWSAYSTIAYILSKLTMIFNDFVQLHLSAYFLGMDSVNWALHPFSLSKQISYASYNYTGSYFPRVTFCDLTRVTLAARETNTLQCVVMLNVINEKIFLLLFYWTAILLFVSLVNFVYIIIRLLFCREASVRFYLQNARENENDFFLKTEKMQLQEFTNHVFGFDGILLLHFLDAHAGALVTRDVVGSLWQSFCNRFKIPKPYLAKNVQQNSFGALNAKEQTSVTPLKFGYQQPSSNPTTNVMLR